jgi:hypothetical protein
MPLWPAHHEGLPFPANDETLYSSGGLTWSGESGPDWVPDFWRTCLKRVAIFQIRFTRFSFLILCMSPETGFRFRETCSSGAGHIEIGSQPIIVVQYPLSPSEHLFAM